MHDMLKPENVQILEKVGCWQEAVKVAIEPLIAGGYVKPCYIDGVLENTAKYGPYYVLMPDLALIHARAEQGVLHRQLAVTLLRQPICFSENGYGVRLLVTLAAEDAKSHTDCLRRLAGLFSSEKEMAKILQAKTPDQLFKLFLGNGDLD